MEKDPPPIGNSSSPIEQLRTSIEESKAHEAAQQASIDRLEESIRIATESARMDIELLSGEEKENATRLVQAGNESVQALLADMRLRLAEKVRARELLEAQYRNSLS